VAIADFWCTLHPTMMEKSTLAGEGGGCTPIPFQPITIPFKIAVYFAPAEWADTLALFHLYQYLYSTLWDGHLLFQDLYRCLF
jgi:hypothetical protein